MSKNINRFRQNNPQAIGNARRLRRELTPAERKLWGVIRNRQLGGRKFRRQHPIGEYIVDFYCAEGKLVIEIDGDVHAHPEQARQDEKRSKHLEELGYKIIRFTNDEVSNNLEGVAQTLLENI